MKERPVHYVAQGLYSVCGIYAGFLNRRHSNIKQFRNNHGALLQKSLVKIVSEFLRLCCLRRIKMSEGCDNCKKVDKKYFNNEGDKLCSTCAEREEECLGKFVFHKVGNSYAQGWYLLIQTEEQLEVFLHHMAHRVVSNWKLIKDSPENKGGHTANQESGMLKYLLTLEMERRGQKKISMPKGIEFLSNVAISVVIEIFIREGEVYVTKNGAARPNTKLLDCEAILDTRVCADLIFPTDEKNSYSITKWPGGNHFYILENGTSIPIDGKCKWKTVGASEDALAFHKRRMEREVEHYGGNDV